MARLHEDARRHSFRFSFAKTDLFPCTERTIGWLRSSYTMRRYFATFYTLLPFSRLAIIFTGDGIDDAALFRQQPARMGAGAAQYIPAGHWHLVAKPTAAFPARRPDFAPPRFIICATFHFGYSSPALLSALGLQWISFLAFPPDGSESGEIPVTRWLLIFGFQRLL